MHMKRSHRPVSAIDAQIIGSTDPTSSEDGSLVTEYGLLAVVAATVAGVLIQWATGGAVVNLFNALVDRARELVGA
jgi:hypothetical protein